MPDTLPATAAPVPADTDAGIYDRLESSVRVYCRKFPVSFVRARDHILWDAQGRSYIDFFAGAGALNYGHANIEITRALIAYLESGALTHGLDLHTPAKAAFLEAFERIILGPRGLDYRVQFTGPTGSNAVEAALKIARKRTGRPGIVAFTNGFHGMSLGALAATGNGAKRGGAGVALQGVARMPFDGYLGPDGDTILWLERMLADPASGLDRPAAFLIETVQGEGGINVAGTAWLQRLQALARREDILLIVDDVQAGCGRTGRFFSFEEAGLVPDLVCLSKSIGGGQPMALVLIRPDLDRQSPGEHTGTFRGNNLAFVAGRVALEFWARNSFLDRLNDNCSRVAEAMRTLCAHYNDTGISSRGRGMLHGLVMPTGEIATRVQRAAFADGLMIETCGPTGEVVKIMPPLTIAEDGLRRGLAILDRAVSGALDRSPAGLA